MGRQLTRSNAHFRKALTKLPLGVASNFRYWGEDKTIYVRKGRGGRITDIDGNTYVDYRLGYGPAILGYADQRIDDAVRASLEIGGVFALSTEAEYRVAERISRMVPAAELVRFSNSGTAGSYIVGNPASQPVQAVCSRFDLYCSPFPHP